MCPLSGSRKVESVRQTYEWKSRKSWNTWHQKVTSSQSGWLPYAVISALLIPFLLISSDVITTQKPQLTEMPHSGLGYLTGWSLSHYPQLLWLCVYTDSNHSNSLWHFVKCVCVSVQNGPYQPLVEFPLGQEVGFLCFLFLCLCVCVSQKNNQWRMSTNEAAEAKITQRNRRDKDENKWETQKQQITSGTKKSVTRTGTKTRSRPNRTSTNWTTMDYEPKKSKKVESFHFCLWVSSLNEWCLLLKVGGRWVDTVIPQRYTEWS